MTSKKNQLATETSPYLLQHQDNPVDWYPWGDTAITKARQEGKPILLSIGYSACHWCHVMAHESFEDPATAKLMNELFINIKVDREERPDLDKVYQISHHMLTRRSGGWPLTMFLTPHDLTPFFGGTYFPDKPRYGMPNFKEILLTVSHYYHEQAATIAQQNSKLREMLQHFTHTAKQSTPLTTEPLKLAFAEIKQYYDHFNGGFGTAPKFPQPHYIQQLLLANALHETDAHDMLINTLTKMARSGLYDHLGGGFFRYAVDAHWHIPHFEKMLYDNAQLLTLYAQTLHLTKHEIFKSAILETAAWTQREMQAANGGYYSTLDADTEQQEGKFYIWQNDEIKQILSAQEYSVTAFCYGLVNPANFAGHWHLQMAKPFSAIAKDAALPAALMETLLCSARSKLFQRREQRTRPARDEKILTSWNGLMIQGMAQAGYVTQQPDYIRSAQQAVDFIRENLWLGKRLLASFKDGKARFMAYLDDYAFLMNGLLTLLQVQWRTEDFNFLIELADTLLHFYEDEHGGFFFTAHDHEQILQRLKPFADEATPSGNGVAAYVLGRLGALLAEHKYLLATEKTLQCAWDLIQQAPAEHQSLLLALQDYLQPPDIIILRGTQHELLKWQQACLKDFQMQRLVLAIPNEVTELPMALAQKVAQAGPIAYICKGLACLEPIDNFGVLERFLANKI